MKDILRYSIKINYRDVLASICINELKILQTYNKLYGNALDSQMIKEMICSCERQIGTDTPLGTYTVCDIFTPYVEPQTSYGRVIYNISNIGVEEAPTDGKQYARQNATWTEVTGGGTDMNVPLVKPTIIATWTNKRTGVTSGSLNISAEIGDTYKWSGNYMWMSKDSYKNPVSMESNVFNELTADSVLSSTVSMETTTNAKYYVTLKAPKTGHEIIDGQIVPATGEDKETASSSISYLYPIYYGIEDKLHKQLTSSNSLTIPGVTTKEDEYFVYMYPSSFPKLTTITQNDAYNVTQAFTYSERQFVTDTNLTLTMRVYTSANPGAFTNAKLNFK